MVLPSIYGRIIRSSRERARRMNEADSVIRFEAKREQAKAVPMTVKIGEDTLDIEAPAKVAERLLARKPAEFHPLDHDKDGHKGGSLPASERDVCDDLREEYELVAGKRADRRWGEARLREEIIAHGGA